MLKIKFLNCTFWAVLRKYVAFLDELNSVSHSQGTWHIKALTATLRSSPAETGFLTKR